MLVDHQPQVRLLEKLGCHCDVAANGMEAVDLVARVPFDLIFMDCQMPVMDGYRATELIRSHEREAGEPRRTIIAMTANALEGDRERCLEVGTDDYVCKPIIASALEQTLARWEPAALAELPEAEDNGGETSSIMETVRDNPDPRGAPCSIFQERMAPTA